jgi:hypothetical protein
MYISKAVTIVMALFQKQEHLPFKQGYDNLRLFRRESALLSDTAQRERHKCRNQCAVYTSLNVPPDICVPTAYTNTNLPAYVFHCQMIFPFAFLFSRRSFSANFYAK